MNIIDIELPNTWLSGATLSWVNSTVDDPSESGFRQPIARQSRPLQQWTFSVWCDDAIAFENYYFQVNGPANGFFARPPLLRLYKVTDHTIGTATGSSQVIQLTLTRGGRTWDMLDPVESTMTVYSNGVALTPVTDWSLAPLGLLTVNSTAGHTLTITTEYKTRFKFLNDELTVDVQSPDIEMPQQAMIQEIFT
jgi:hypothetical protein